MCRRVFNKTIILLGLAGYEMIITNEARIISYPGRPRRIIVNIYLTIIPRGRVLFEYEMIIANEARSAELAIIISYPTSPSGIIALLKTTTKFR